MLRGSRTINLYFHSGAIPLAPRATRPQFLPSQWGYFVCPEGHAPSVCTLTLKLFRVPRGSRALSLYAHPGDISHAPRATYPQFVPSLRSYFVRSKGHAPSICTLAVGLFRMLRGSRILNLHPQSGDISDAHLHFPPSLRSYIACSEGHAPSICTLTVELFRTLRWSRTLNL